MEVEPYENPWFVLIPDIRRLLRYQYLCAMDRVALMRTCKRAAQEDMCLLNHLWPRAWMTYAQEALERLPILAEKKETFCVESARMTSTEESRDHRSVLAEEKEAYYAERTWLNKAREMVLCSRIDDGPLLRTQPYLHMGTETGYAIVWARHAVYYLKESNQWATYACAGDIIDTEAVLREIEHRLYITTVMMRIHGQSTAYMELTRAELVRYIMDRVPNQ